MRLISCHDGKLQTFATGARAGEALEASRTFRTGFAEFDALLPESGLAFGAIHEILAEPAVLSHCRPEPAMTPAFWLARSALESRQTGAIVCCDPQARLYPPGLVALGIPLDRLYLLRPARAAEVVWALSECLRCPGVAAVVAPVGRLTRVEARRLQLASEAGGGVGLLMRPLGPASEEYAAATRWAVRPVPGDRTIRRWNLRLIHGHGGRVGKSAFLEICRELEAFAISVRAAEPIARRAVLPAAARPA